jgi:hypothetical protein
LILETVPVLNIASHSVVVSFLPFLLVDQLIEADTLGLEVDMAGVGNVEDFGNASAVRVVVDLKGLWLL